MSKAAGGGGGGVIIGGVFPLFFLHELTTNNIQIAQHNPNSVCW
jgi:hypothetical protein